jgi:serine/threonine-protein kinase
MGTVYLALDNITENQLDAVKILNRDLLVDRERLRREAVTANRVDHPNVCRIYNYVEAYDPESSTALTLIAMELVRGPTLREIQEERGGILELGRAGLVVKEVGEALTAIHSQDIVHRDIKPTNIIVTRDSGQPERVKIVDFGIAKAVGGGAGQDLTEPGFVAATVHYASPELLRGKPEKRSDVYALGVVLYEILTGRRPFEATNQAELFSMILDPGVRPPTLDQTRPGMSYPRGLQAVVDRALERDPDKRFSSPADFSAAFVGLVPELAETVRIPLSDLPPDLGAQAASAPVASPPRSEPVPPRPLPELVPPPHKPAAVPLEEPEIAPSPSSEPPPPGGGFPWKSPVVMWGGAGGVLALFVVLFLAFGGGNLFSGGSSSEGGAFSVSPASAFLASGDTLGLVPSGEGVEEGGGFPEIRWVSQDPEVVRIGPPGMVIGGRAGATSVMAILDGDTVRVSIQVTPGPPARLTLVPPSLRLVPGEGGQLGVSVTDAQDNLILDPGLEWTSSAPNVAEVDAGGLVRARTPGTAVIRAEAADVWNQATVEVGASPEPPPPSQPRALACPDPVMDELDRLEGAMDDPGASRQELRAAALECWNRGAALNDEERAYAAWLIGLNTVNLEGCSQSAILWLDRAVRLDPESDAYRVARAACGGGVG